jgi:hypothetical protein
MGPFALVVNMFQRRVRIDAQRSVAFKLCRFPSLVLWFVFVKRRINYLIAELLNTSALLVLRRGAGVAAFRRRYR